MCRKAREIQVAMAACNEQERSRVDDDWIAA
jgi:hypothetical protein